MANKPENTNYLQPTKYLLTFPQISDTVYLCHKVNLPGVSVNELPRMTPNIDLYVPGTRISYGTLDIEFSVNETLSSWIVIHDWLRDNSIDGEFRYKNVDAVLTILSNLNNPKIRIKYTNVFPISLGDIEFDTRLSASDHIFVTASFRFDNYDIEMI